MNRLKIILFLFLTVPLIMSLLSACTPNTPSASSESQPTDPSGTSAKSIHFESVSDFEQYLENKQLTDWVVAYDNLESLGAFKSVVFLDHTHKSYMYTFIDKSGIDFDLYVEHNVDAAEETSDDMILSEAEVALSDLRRINKTTRSKYTQSGLSYKYIQGGLVSISWTEDNVVFRLYLGAEGKSYPLDANTFVAKLLTHDTAQTAVNEINDLVK